METIGERLKYLIDSKEDNLSKFCEKYKFNYVTIQQICINKRTLGINVLQDLMKVFPNLNINWLLYGKGTANYYINEAEETNLIKEPGELYNVDLMEKVILKYLNKQKVQEKIKEIVENSSNEEKLMLKFEIGKENSELVEKIEQMFQTSQKLPTKKKK